jgi:hypothetical protein
MNGAFSPEAIIAACAELTRIREPNFMYLDRVLAAKYAEGKTTAESHRKRRRSGRGGQAHAPPLRPALGAKGVKREFIEYLRRWRAEGLADGAILLLCGTAAERGVHTFAEADGFISRYVERGITDGEGIEKDLLLEADARGCSPPPGFQSAR